jgi:peroxiredoxin
MTPRSLVVLGSLVAIALQPACKTTAGALPGWDDPAGGDAVAAAPGEPSGDDAAADPEPGDPASEGDEADAGAGTLAVGEPAPAPAPDPAADPAPEPGDPQGSAAAPAALPDPVYTKIDKKCGKDPGVGERLKAFDLATTEGGKVTAGTYRGRVLVVNFWGTWCKPCLKELPEFDQLYRRYRKHGMTLLAIATDEDATAVNEFKKKRRLAAKLAIGGEDYAGKYSSTQFPFTFVVDTKGVIKSSFRGYKPECMGKLEDDIRKELDKRAKARAG